MEEGNITGDIYTKDSCVATLLLASSALKTSIDERGVTCSSIGVSQRNDGWAAIFEWHPRWPAYGFFRNSKSESGVPLQEHSGSGVLHAPSKSIVREDNLSGVDVDAGKLEECDSSEKLEDMRANRDHN
jgi:hypothetical protein